MSTKESGQTGVTVERLRAPRTAGLGCTAANAATAGLIRLVQRVRARRLWAESIRAGIPADHQPARLASQKGARVPVLDNPRYGDERVASRTLRLAQTKVAKVVISGEEWCALS